jgi:exonuclease VII large subunit
VADLRAPTPSAAAELAVRPKADFEEAVRTEQQRRLAQALRSRVLEFRNRFTRAARSYVFREPDHLLQHYRERVARCATALGTELQAAFAEQQQRVDEAGAAAGPPARAGGAVSAQPDGAAAGPAAAGAEPAGRAGPRLQQPK